VADADDRNYNADDGSENALDPVLFSEFCFVFHASIIAQKKEKVKRKPHLFFVFFNFFFDCISRCLSSTCAAPRAPAPQVIDLQGLTDEQQSVLDFQLQLFPAD
jgi:hypothetical protein